MPQLRPLLALALLSALPACQGGFLDTIDDILEPAVAEPGLLGHGEFFYICEGATDTQCDSDQMRGDFPRRFAVGNRFGLHYERTDELLDDTVGQSPRSGAPARLEELGASSHGASFVPRAAGGSPAIVTEGQRIIDLVFIDAELPTRLALVADDADVTALTLAPGDEVELRASPRDADGDGFPGVPIVQWSVADGALVELLDVRDDTVRVRALAPGETALTAAGAAETSLIITVAGGEPATTGSSGDTGEDGSGSSGDTGSSGSSGDTGDAGSSGATGDTTGDTTGGAL